jgi:hypothetical protein
LQPIVGFLLSLMVQGNVHTDSSLIAQVSITCAVTAMCTPILRTIPANRISAHLFQQDVVIYLREQMTIRMATKQLYLATIRSAIASGSQAGRPSHLVVLPTDAYSASSKASEDEKHRADESEKADADGDQSAT